MLSKKILQDFPLENCVPKCPFIGEVMMNSDFLSCLILCITKGAFYITFSQTGKRLMAKCRMLIQENEELGKVITSGRTAKLEGEIATQKELVTEIKSNQSGKASVTHTLQPLCDLFAIKFHNDPREVGFGQQLIRDWLLSDRRPRGDLFATCCKWSPICPD